MGKILKPLAIVAGVVAAVASAGSLLAFGKIAGTFLGVSIKTLNLIAAGLSIASSVLAPRPKAPQASRENIERLEASVIPRTPRKIWFGHTAGATDIRDQEYTDNQGFLHRFVVVASHKINGVQQIWFDDKPAWTSAGGAQGEYAGYLNVTVINEGSAANAINISARMGNTRRYTGLAYVYLRYKLTGNNKKTQSPFAQSIPSRMTIRGKGALVYDPRMDSTVAGGSGPQRANDQSTWAWSDSASRNPALQLLWWLLGWRINGLLAVGKGIPANRIDLASFIVAANLCDEPVTLAVGGTEPRYRSDQLFSEGDSASVVLDGLRSTMNADLDDVDGKLRLTVFHNDLAVPVANFTDDDIIDTFNWQQTPSLHDTFNIVRGAYTDPSDISLYQPAEYPEVALSSPDGIDRIDSFDLPGVQSVSQAQRLAKTRLQRGQYGGTFSTVLNARGWKVQKNDVVTVTLSRLGWTNKLFRVAEMEHRTDGTCPITLREEHVSIYAWDSDEAPAVTPTAPTVYDFSKSAINLDLLSAINTAQFPAEPPSDWAVGSIYIDQTGRKFRFAGRQLTFNGEPLTFYGEPIFTSGYVDAQDQATVAALAAASIAQNLATDAAAIADGKVQTFYQPNAPLDASEGDIWIDTDGGNNQYRYTSGAWVDVQDTGIGQAIADAAGAQATADGKVTTYVNETAPTAEALGDLWFKPSTKYLARWDGVEWLDIATIGAPSGTPVGTITASDVSDTINSGGGVAANKVNTASIIAGSVNKIVAGYNGDGSSTNVATNTEAVIITVTITNVLATSSFLVQGGSQISNFGSGNPDGNHKTGTTRIEYRINNGTWLADTAIGVNFARFFDITSTVEMTQDLNLSVTGLYSIPGLNNGDSVSFRIVGLASSGTNGWGWRHRRGFIIATEIKR